MGGIYYKIAGMPSRGRERLPARPSLKALLLSDQGRGDLVLPERGQARRRRVQEIL
jgi:hypothetical protein